MKLLMAVLPGDLPQVDFGLAWETRSVGTCVEVRDAVCIEANLSAYEYDALLLNRSFIDKPTETLRNWRARNPKLAIVILGPADVQLIARCLRAGADDYVRTPAHLEELLARLRACVRRHHGHSAELLQFDGYAVDLERQRLYIGLEPVHLSKRPWQVVSMLTLNAGRVVHRSALCDYLYDHEDPPEDKIFDVFMCKIRALFRKHLGRDPIKTEWGRGWIWELPNESQRRRENGSDDRGGRRADDADREVATGI